MSFLILSANSSSVSSNSWLLLIDRGDVPIAVRAMRVGAVDVLEKPYRDVNLLERVMRAAAAASA